MATQVTSYDLVGKKEDVSDIISNISPTKTPFTTMAGSEKVSNTIFEWQEDALRSAADNAQKQGFTAAPTARAPTVMRENVTQIMQDTFQVAGTTDVVSTYGRAKESAYQMSKAMAALKLDLERAYVGTGQVKVKPTDNTQAAVFAGYQAQVDASHFVYTGGTGTAMTEANLLSALQTDYNDGADPSIIMVRPERSLTIAAFAAAAGRYRTIQNSGDQKTITNAVDLYVSPFGEQKVVLNRFQKVGDTLVMDPENWVKMTLRPWFKETLAKTGDNTSYMIVGEFSLKHKNQKASSVVREDVAV